MRYYMIKSKHASPFTRVSFSENMRLNKETERVHYDFKGKDISIPIMVVQGHILISSSLKEVFALYSHSEIEKQIIFLDSHSNISQSYWLLEGLNEECLSKETTYHFNNSVHHMVLDKEKIQGHHIVGIRMMKSTESKLVPIKVIVSLAVAESLLRRGICDVVFEEIVVDGGDYNG